MLPYTTRKFCNTETIQTHANNNWVEFLTVKRIADIHLCRIYFDLIIPCRNSYRRFFFNFFNFYYYLPNT